MVLSDIGTNAEWFSCLHGRSLVKKSHNSQGYSQVYPVELPEILAPVLCLHLEKNAQKELNLFLLWSSWLTTFSSIVALPA